MPSITFGIIAITSRARFVGIPLASNRFNSKTSIPAANPSKYSSTLTPKFSISDMGIIGFLFDLYIQASIYVAISPMGHVKVRRCEVCLSNSYSLKFPLRKRSASQSNHNVGDRSPQPCHLSNPLSIKRILPSSIN